MAMNSTDIYVPDRLVMGDADIVTDSHTLILGQNLKRGAALGKITAGGKLTLLNSGNADGSQAPYAILANDTNATAADQVCAVYKAGEFSDNIVIFGGADTAATHKEAFRGLGIYLKTPTKA